MLTFHLALLVLAILGNFAQAQDKWAWPKGKNQKVIGYYPSANNKIYYTDNQAYARADRDREPTTKRPLPGEVANDDIEDYSDDNEQSGPPTRQNSPYPQGGGVGNPGFAGAQPGFGGQPGFGIQPGFGVQPGGFNQYPQFAGGAGYPGSVNPNGILVGPGGPTGIIGRPQTSFPAHYPGQVGYPGYPTYNTQNFAASANPGYSGVGQYPNPQQQFAAGPGQYPGAQQYPQGSHQFTEGYGLSPYAQGNGGYQPNNPSPLPPQNFNGGGYPSYGSYPAGSGYPGYQDEYVPEYRAKSANVKVNDKKIDDKVSKNLKKS